jgi:hypothetical protein
MIETTLLNKFFDTPGLCSTIELSRVKKFLLTYKEHHDIYRTATNREPLGHTLSVELDKVDWYINNKK